MKNFWRLLALAVLVVANFRESHCGLRGGLARRYADSTVVTSLHMAPKNSLDQLDGSSSGANEGKRYSRPMKPQFSQKRNLSNQGNQGNQGQYQQNKNPKSTFSGDARRLSGGKVVEYVNQKGSKRLALINRRLGAYLEVTNEAQRVFTIPIGRVSYLVEAPPSGYSQEDLAALHEVILDLRPSQVEALYNRVSNSNSNSNLASTISATSIGATSSATSNNNLPAYTLSYISSFIFESNQSHSAYRDSRDRFTNTVHANAKAAEVQVTVQTEDGQGQGGAGANSGADTGTENVGADRASSPRTPQRVKERSLELADPMQIFAAFRLMQSFGDIFFNPSTTETCSRGTEIVGLELNALAAASANDDDVLCFTPLGSSTVQENMKERAALREFKQRYKKLTEGQSQGSSFSRAASSSTGNTGGSSSSSSTSRGGNAGPYQALTQQGMLTPEMPERVAQALGKYSEGLKQLVVKKHPWVAKGIARREWDSEAAKRGQELLEFLDLAPTVKNAKKVLEVSGIWPKHTNVEKYVMQIRDRFPPEVLDEARKLLQNRDSQEDADERIRRDLCHLGTYAIDGEGATEVDDAVSIEYLRVPVLDGDKDGDDVSDVSLPAEQIFVDEDTGERYTTVEKVWIHIADVSRWVLPGSQLSIEAERRMTSVYMPDERISLFPEILTTELLSLGAGGPDESSYALSCGVVLDAHGAVKSYEVCPSRVRVTRRLTYTQLEDILLRESRDAKQKQCIGIAGEVGPYNASSPDISAGETCQPLLSPPPLAPLGHNGVMGRDLARLQQWAQLRNRRRIEKGALDDMLRHKTELSLSVKNVSNYNYNYNYNNNNNNNQNERGEGGSGQSGHPNYGNSGPAKLVVSGYMSWSNSSSVSLVSEYMVLMCQVIGMHCSGLGDVGSTSTSADKDKDASPPLLETGESQSESESQSNYSAGYTEGDSYSPRPSLPKVWYKTQTPQPALDLADIQLQQGENPFLRSARIIRHLRAANDSKIPALHCTSGSPAYVQCTSPIRRYHDLYNHYRLKAAMHAASLGADYAHRAEEEAGITMLDNMATAEQRLSTIHSIRLVTRHREQYWMRMYMEKLVYQQNPRLIFDCMIFKIHGSYSDELWNQDNPGGVDQSQLNTLNTLNTDETEEEPVSVEGESASASVRVDRETGKVMTASTADEVQTSVGGVVAAALVLQLGSYMPYKVYVPEGISISTSEVIKCHLYKRFTNPVSYALLPIELSSKVIDYINLHGNGAGNVNSNANTVLYQQAQANSGVEEQIWGGNVPELVLSQLMSSKERNMKK